MNFRLGCLFILKLNKYQAKVNRGIPDFISGFSKYPSNNAEIAPLNGNQLLKRCTDISKTCIAYLDWTAGASKRDQRKRGR